MVAKWLVVLARRCCCTDSEDKVVELEREAAPGLESNTVLEPVYGRWTQFLLGEADNSVKMMGWDECWLVGGYWGILFWVRRR
jgi:hypothetical protein